MRLLMLGVNHRTASLAMREKLAVGEASVARVLQGIRAIGPNCEAVLLSTCNRTEVYLARPSHQPPSAEQIVDFFAQLCDVPKDQLQACVSLREQEEALRHLFRVSMGLDSMVLGEPQILGQVKRAYEFAVDAGTVGPVLHRVFQQGVTTAKQARTQTNIGKGRVSVGSVAVDFAKQIFDHFDNKSVACLGAGEMSKTMLRHLLALCPRQTWIVNRSPERAMSLAQTLNVRSPMGGVRAWADMEQVLIDADIVLTSTGSDSPPVTYTRMKNVVKRRRRRPLFIIDIAIPRDVEQEVGSLSNIYLYNIDDLNRVAAGAVNLRSDQIEQCEQRVSQTVDRCMREIQNRDIGQLIRELRERLHALGEQEKERTRRKLTHLQAAEEQTESMDELIDEHTRRLINKILHLPLSQLDHNDPDAPLGFYAAALRRLFDLEVNDADESVSDVTPQAERNPSSPPKHTSCSSP